MHSVKAGGAGEGACGEGGISRECATELHNAAEVGKQKRQQLAALVVNGNKSIVSFSVERGQTLRQLLGSWRQKHSMPKPLLRTCASEIDNGPMKLRLSGACATIFICLRLMVTSHWSEGRGAALRGGEHRVPRLHLRRGGMGWEGGAAVEAGGGEQGGADCRQR